MPVCRQLGRALLAATLAVGWTRAAQAEVKLAEAGGWTVSTDGRVNAFVSHVRADQRPEGLDNLIWVGFNESPAGSQADNNNKLQRTKIRSGYVPATLAFNFKKQMLPQLKVASRIEVGFQITNTEPAEVADPTWMDPRSIYLDLSGGWGSVRAGRDLSLFPRSNLFMNYELGHAYGLGFPCAYQKMFGGACGHVGFGTLWPDFRAQITYTTPSIGDVFQWSVGLFDPRAIVTYQWFQTPIPRVETEAVANFSWQPGWGIKAWANGMWQRIGTTSDVDMMPSTTADRTNHTQNAYGVGGGLQAALGPVKAGFAGYMGQGMDAFVTFTFNPIFVSQGATTPNHERKFRPTKGFLGHASVTFGDTWVMGGFGQALLDRMATDRPINDPAAFPLLRTQRGISGGLFHRIEQVVLGLDYFNARYGFDPRLTAAGTYIDVSQVVHIFNAGVTLEW
jgi:hypothetical protein